MTVTRIKTPTTVAEAVTKADKVTHFHIKVGIRTALRDVGSNDHVNGMIVCQAHLRIQYVDINATRHVGAPASM